MKKLVNLIVVLAILSSLFCTLNVKAVKFADKKMLLPLGTDGFIAIEGLKKHMKIKHIDVRDKKICDAGVNNPKVVCVRGKRIGKTIVSGDAYIGKKFKSRFYTTVIVYKYKNPFLNVSIGNKSFTKRFNGVFNNALYSKKTYKGKINIKLKKGFKLRSIKLYKLNRNRDENKKTITLKKHSYISLKNENLLLEFEIYNKRYKASEYLGFSRVLKE